MQSLYRLVLLAKQIFTDEVYHEIYSELLEQHAKHTLLCYMERLSTFGVALRNVVAMRKTYWRIGHSKRPSKVAITILEPPTSRNWNAPSLSTLLCDHYKEIDRKSLPPRIEEAYMQQTRLPLQQHIEMRVLDHCLSNPELWPVIYYIGITESPCILCERFLKKFKQQNIRNRTGIEHSWKVGSKSSIWEGRWLPPAGESSSRENAGIKKHLAEIKRELIEETRTTILSSFKTSDALCLGYSKS